MSPAKKLSIGFLGLSILYGGFVFWGQATAQEPTPQISLERDNEGEQPSIDAAIYPASIKDGQTGNELNRLVTSLPGNDQLTTAGISLDSEFYRSLKNYLDEYYQRKIVAIGTQTETVVKKASKGTTQPVDDQDSVKNSAEQNKANAKPEVERESQTAQKENATTRLGQAVADRAKSLIGSPYRYGGESPSGFDSSGLVQYVYGKSGIDLPRRVIQQVEVGTSVSRSDLRIGDLVFFGNPSSRRTPTLVGIYIGNGEFVASASAYGGVDTRSLDSSYYEKYYITARRITESAARPVSPEEPSDKPAKPSEPPSDEKDSAKDKDQPNNSASSKADKVIEEARKWMGYPYRFGADGVEDGAFDCSSFTRYVFRKVGVSLPRTSRSQAKVGTPVSKSSLKKGDLLFFDASSSTGAKGAVDHVGIYMGDGKFIHTYKPGIGVTISSFSGFWERSFLFARRVL